MKKITILIPLLLLFLMTLALSVYAAESTTITCYLGSPSDNEDAGEIEFFDVTNATNACNKTFNDCEGKCTGCYINEEGFEMCTDEKGAQFKRE